MARPFNLMAIALLEWKIMTLQKPTNYSKKKGVFQKHVLFSGLLLCQSTYNWNCSSKY